jgi:hypothetical protein
MKLGGALVTKPDEKVRSISPEDGADFTGHLYGIVNTQSLQRLNVKRAIVKIAFSTFVSMDTLPLTKHLSRHNQITTRFLRNTRILRDR